MRAHLTILIAAGLVLTAARAEGQTALGHVPSPEEQAVMPPDDTAEIPGFSDHAALYPLAEDLAELWTGRPELFEEVNAARDAVIAWYRQGGHRPLNVARILDAIGEDRLLPLLWALADDDPIALGMGLRAWQAWRIGLVESVGRLGDTRSIPLLRSMVEGEDPHGAVRRAAVGAIGRTGDAEGIAAVIAVAQDAPDKRSAVIAGLGQARRQIAADYLLEVARTDADPALRRTAIRSLGDWGNAMAWRTSSLAPFEDEGEAGRRAIVTALVELYPGADAVIRAEIEKTLQLTDVHASATLAGRRAEETAGGETADAERRAAWHDLSAKMQRSPLWQQTRR